MYLLVITVLTPLVILLGSYLKKSGLRNSLTRLFIKYRVSADEEAFLTSMLWLLSIIITSFIGAALVNVGVPFSIVLSAVLLAGLFLLYFL